MSGILAAAGVSAAVGLYASNQSANAMSSAAGQAAGLSQAQYNQTRQDQMPYMQAGYQALERLQDPKYQQTFDASKMQLDPGYAFRQAEAQKALDRSAASRGMSLSGAQIKATDRFTQDYASNEYNNAYNRFNNDLTTLFNRDASIAGLGQTANGTTASAGANNVANQTSAITGAANASAAGTMGSANAITSGIGSGMNNWMSYQLMNKFAPQNYSGGTSSMGGYSGSMVPSTYSSQNFGTIGAE